MGALVSTLSSDQKQFFRTVKHGRDKDVLNHVTAAPQRLKSTTFISKRNAFHLLAAQGRTTALQLLLQYISEHPEKLHLSPSDVGVFCKSLVNSPDSSSRTPAILAAKHDQPDTLQFLLSVGADICLGDWHGNTAIHYAALLGNTACLEILLAEVGNCPAEISRANLSGYTPLHYAVWGQHPDAAQLLLSYSASISASSWRNWDPYVPCLPWTTPLHIAAIHNQVTTACLILKVYMDRLEVLRAHGEDEEGLPDPRLAVNHYGNTPQDVALQLNRRRLGRLLQPGIPLRRVMRVMGLELVTMVGVPKLGVLAATAYRAALREQLQRVAAEPQSSPAASPAAGVASSAAQQQGSALQVQQEARQQQEQQQRKEDEAAADGRLSVCCSQLSDPELQPPQAIEAAAVAAAGTPPSRLLKRGRHDGAPQDGDVDSSSGSSSTCSPRAADGPAAADADPQGSYPRASMATSYNADAMLSLSGPLHAVSMPVEGPSAGAQAEPAISSLQRGPSGVLARLVRGPSRLQLQRRDSEVVCDVCFELRELLAVRPCTHRLCCQCALAMCQQDKPQPVTCPFCRVNITGFGARR